MTVNMNRPGEHSLPAPNNEASRTPVSGYMQHDSRPSCYLSTSKDVVVQQPGNSELQEPVVGTVRTLETRQLLTFCRTFDSTSTTRS